jgi:hypothetical protein
MHEAFKKDSTVWCIRDLFQTATELIPGGKAWLRDRPPLKLPLVRLEACRAGIGFYGARLWNHLPPSLRSIENTSVFVKRYAMELMKWLEENGRSRDFCPAKFYEFV